MMVGGSLARGSPRPRKSCEWPRTRPSARMKWGGRRNDGGSSFLVMPVFQYKAFQTDGKTAEGQIEAGGRQEAFRQMEERGLRPISLAEKANGAAASNGSGAAAPAGGLSFKFQSTKITPRMLENFTRLLSSLLAAGVPLSRALVILCKEASTPTAAAKWRH